MKHGLWICALLATALSTGCDNRHGEPETEMKTVSGTLNYRERMMLTPEAVAKISLQDVSRADADAVVIDEVEITNPGQVPIPFELNYDPEQIDERMSYHVQAQIFDGGELKFASDSHNHVLTRGGSHEIDIHLVRVRQPRVSPPDPADSGAQTKRGNLRSGMFTYMADAALFEDCRDNRLYPVAMEGAYSELERAYLNSGIEDGGALLVEVDGRFQERVSMEGNRNEVMLIVDSFEAILPEQSCLPPVDEPLINTYWKLRELDGQTVTTPEGQREAHIILAKDESRVRGFAGCNNFFGTHQVDGDSLSFSSLGTTMMACLEGMDTETGVLAALEASQRYEISGAMLSLFEGDKLLVKFEAVHLP
ncbi:MAG: META domain-containing protein [Xanthomonadales bacterium]|nr:YbaY family lipoprotein [Gammaproteobacteria bacterium]NNJ79874.1 META domain-containing protein [Xanthomonadales bacterium]NNL03723.1 META domain-containing protein [Xanthomonadales bacterium]